MLRPYTPNPELPHVADFCRHVAPDETPILIPHKPLPGKPIRECFGIVPEQVIGQSGKQLIGWAIWETPGLFIEAEFHAIWQNNEGRLLDITPQQLPFENILFLPDPRHEYHGRQVDNIRRPLVDDLDVIRLLHLAQKRFLITNKGDLANQHGALPPRAEREWRKIDKEMFQLYLRLGKRSN